jgi:hypothetical protein
MVLTVAQTGLPGNLQFVKKKMQYLLSAIKGGMLEHQSACLHESLGSHNLP